MAPITSLDGPVAVTGAAGYIGAWVVKNLVDHGYTVRACVRDKNRKDRTEHLLAMNGRGVGKLELVEADMTKAGVYDAVFKGCSAVFHIATDLGHGGYGNPWADGKVMYDGIMNGTKNVLGAIKSSGSVKRLIYTSSGAAVKGPSPPGYYWSESDFCGVGGPQGQNRSTFPYGIGKMHSELLCYDWGPKHAVDVVTIIPEHVIGPLMGPAHDFGWQHDIGETFVGRYHKNQLWGITDVRDLAEAYRLVAESSVARWVSKPCRRCCRRWRCCRRRRRRRRWRRWLEALQAPELQEVARNGSRYFVVTPASEGGAPTPPVLVDMLRSIYPDDKSVCGTKPPPGGQEYMPVRTTKAKDELGLRYTNPKDTLKDNVESLKALGVIDDIRRKMAEKAARSKL